MMTDKTLLVFGDIRVLFCGIERKNLSDVFIPSREGKLLQKF
jgi:hypothetical protein